MLGVGFCRVGQGAEIGDGWFSEEREKQCYSSESGEG